jgi:glycosyltransferase involved in cell wall biosynthesis
MRYPSPAVGLGIPLVLGPVGGSLDSPIGFAREETSSPWYVGLRSLDRVRMQRDPLLRSTYERADCVLGIAPYVQDMLQGLRVQRFEVMSETGLDHLPPAVDRSGRTGPVRLLHVGRLVRTKGARDVIRAMSLVADLPVVLDVVGDGFDRGECARLIKELNLGSRVVLHGSLPRPDLDDFYRRADVFVYPSYREPGGNVVFEAMGFGLPLIVADRGGPEAAVDDTCALRVPAISPAQLARDCATAISSLVRDGDLRRRMGEAARTRVSVTALWSHKIMRMNEIYAEAQVGHTEPTSG